MKFKVLILSFVLIPALASADSSFFSWITNLKVVPEVKPVQKIIREVKKEVPKENPKPIVGEYSPVPTSNPVFASSTILNAIKAKLATTTQHVLSSSKETELLSQILKLKSENESLRKTISSLQIQIGDLNKQAASYTQNLEKVKAQSSPKVLARIKELEWLIKGTLDNNYRNKIDADGNKQAEMVVNSSFFRSPAAEDFKSMIKEYDSLTGTDLYTRLKEYTNTQPSGELKKFEEFYYHFIAIRKFQT